MTEAKFYRGFIVKIARGSIHDGESMIEVCSKSGRLASAQVSESVRMAEKLNPMLSALIRSVEANPKACL